VLRTCHWIDIVLHRVVVVAPDDWTVVPLLVKVYKLVINELSNQIEKATSTRATAGDEDEVCIMSSHPL